MKDKIKVIYIVGPTASGKTSLGIEVAKRCNGEIISADSMQIYKGIHIASAAPNDSEKQGIPHHLIEFLELTDFFSVADYVKKARETINEISARGKTPIVVGGTGLYISSLTDNIEFSEEKSDTALRDRLEAEMIEIGAEKMLEKLAAFDEESAKKLHPNNQRRILRAFEVYYTTGKTITEQNRLSKQNQSPYEPVIIGIDYSDRSKLYQRINQRVDIMIKNGIIDEAKATIKLNNGKGASQAIGHKELYGYLNGENTIDEAIEKLKTSTRRYAKRQLTWFRKDNRIKWIYADKTSDLIGEAMKIIG